MEKTFQHRLSIIIERIGSRANLARASGVSVRSLSNYVNGETQPKGEVIARLATAAGVRVEWLLTGAEPMLAERPKDMRSDEALKYSVRETPDPDSAYEAMRRIRDASDLLQRLQAETGCDVYKVLGAVLLELLAGQQITETGTRRLLETFRAEVLSHEPPPEPEIERREDIEGVTLLPEREPKPWRLVQPRRRSTDRKVDGK